MFSKKKLVKTAAVGCGVYAIMELCTIMGEAQAFASMREVCPEEVDEVLDALSQSEQFKGEIPICNRMKAKAVGVISKFCINNDVFK